MPLGHAINSYRGDGAEAFSAAKPGNADSSGAASGLQLSYHLSFVDDAERIPSTPQTIAEAYKERVIAFADEASDRFLTEVEDEQDCGKFLEALKAYVASYSRFIFWGRIGQMRGLIKQFEQLLEANRGLQFLSETERPAPITLPSEVTALILRELLKDNPAALDADEAGPESASTSNESMEQLTPEMLRSSFGLYKSAGELHRGLRPQMQHLANQLVEHVLFAREEEAFSIIRQFPQILAMRGTGYHPVGGTYENITAFQAALYRRDVQLFGKIRCLPKNGLNLKKPGEERQVMAERMFAQLAEQFEEVFPDGVDTMLEEQHAFDFSVICKAFNVVCKVFNDAAATNQGQTGTSSIRDALVTAILSFREAFAETVSQEKHANLKHLIEVERIRYDGVYCFNEWPTWLKDIFAVNVVGYVQRYLSPDVQQILHQTRIDSYADVDRPNYSNERFSTLKDEGKVSLFISSSRSSGAGYHCYYRYMLQQFHTKNGGICSNEFHALERFANRKNEACALVSPSISSLIRECSSDMRLA
jgi:hypothetical protein